MVYSDSPRSNNAFAKKHGFRTIRIDGIEYDVRAFHPIAFEDNIYSVHFHRRGLIWLDRNSYHMMVKAHDKSDAILHVTSDPHFKYFHEQSFLKASKGYHGIVTRPTKFLVGEKGAERVDVTPIKKGVLGMDGIKINMPNLNLKIPKVKI